MASEIAAITSGTLFGPDVMIDGATHDSRLVRAGQLFVALKAERDGHRFIAEALEAGAAAYLTEHPAEQPTAVVVADTSVALDDLARAARARLPARIVGITGSVGKTSTKDLLIGALSQAGPAAASPHSFNNEIGVPLTLLGAPDDAHAVVVEMGARGRGQIARLCEIARPTIGVVTSVGACHTEQFGSIEVIARSKAELVESLGPDATAVLNVDDPRVASMTTYTKAHLMTFGTGPSADVRVTILDVDDELRPLVCLETPQGMVELRLSARGAHQGMNAAAAMGAALACEVPLGDIALGLSEATVSAWRMQLEHAPSGALIVNDTYNANPLSVEAALMALRRLPAQRRTAVLGTMAELGALHDEEHLRIGRLAAEHGIRVIAVASPEYGPDAEQVADVEGALSALGTVGPGDAVLVKASRAAGLEILAARLAASPVGEGSRA